MAVHSNHGAFHPVLSGPRNDVERAVDSGAVAIRHFQVRIANPKRSKTMQCEVEGRKHPVQHFVRPQNDSAKLHFQVEVPSAKFCQ